MEQKTHTGIKYVWELEKTLHTFFPEAKIFTHAFTVQVTSTQQNNMGGGNNIATKSARDSDGKGE